MKAECAVKAQRDDWVWLPQKIRAFYAADKRPTFGRSDLDGAVKDKVQALIAECWNQTPEVRPTFDSIFQKLQEICFKLFRDVNVKVIDAYMESVLAWEAGNQ
jgi:hypothetical protein